MRKALRKIGVWWAGIGQGVKKTRQASVSTKRYLKRHPRQQDASRSQTFAAMSATMPSRSSCASQLSVMSQLQLFGVRDPVIMWIRDLAM